jgi:hypothetical protein
MSEDSIPPDSAGQSKIKSANRVLLGLALLAAGWTLYGTTANVSRFWGLTEVFKQVRVPLPGLAVLALEQGIAIDVIVVVIAGTCVFMTFRDPQRIRTIFANVAGIVLPLIWWLLQTSVFYISSAVVLEISHQGHSIGR